MDKTQVRQPHYYNQPLHVHKLVLLFQRSPPTLYDCCVPAPLYPSLRCTASAGRELRTVPAESLVSVHYLISGGTDCGDSLIHIHIQYKHN